MLSSAVFDNVVRFDGLFYDGPRCWLYILYEHCPWSLPDLVEGRLSMVGGVWRV